MSDTTDRDGAGAAGFAALASSAPRPLPDVVAEARAVLSRRDITLETEGLEALEAGAAPPGMRQQLVRVLGELVSNMAKYAAPGSARFIIDAIRSFSSESPPAAGTPAPSSGAARAGTAQHPASSSTDSANKKLPRIRLKKIAPPCRDVKPPPRVALSGPEAVFSRFLFKPNQILCYALFLSGGFYFCMRNGGGRCCLEK